MCLITEKTKPIKIRKDRTVYKLFYKMMNGKLVTAHQYYVYEFNVLYKTEFSFLDVDSDFACAFDSLVDEIYDKFSKRQHRTDLIVIAEGFHSASIPARFRLESDNVIVECTIPKGSLIYEDSTGLIVSNQIIINKVI